MSDNSRSEQTNGAEKTATDQQPAESANPVDGSTANQTTVSVELSMEAQLSEAQSKAAEYLDGWQRARADFVNYKKRSDQERAEAYGTATVDSLRKLLPIIDDFDRAIINIPAERADDDVIKGFSLIHRKLLTLLENAGIAVMNPLGQEFDPKYHEAIGRDESSDVESGHVSAVLQKGYLYGDKVLRPALVRIAG